MTPGFVPTAGPSDFSPEDARTLTDQVKADAVALWEKLLALYDGNAHHALNYKSWAAYCKDEFDIGRSRAYQLLGAARVSRALAESTIVDQPVSEAVARELAPKLKKGPEAVREALAQTVQEHGPEPTAAQVRQTVQGADGDALNGSGAAHSAVAVEARCPTCGGPFRAEVVDDGPEPEPVVSPGDPVPAWMQDPGHEAGWTPLADEAGSWASGEGAW